MKATVLEIKDGFAALLQEDGTVIKMKNKNLKIGDVVNMKQAKTQTKRKFVSIVAAAAMLVMMMGGGMIYATPSYHVSLDVNPGIMMEVNMFERVIGMEAANEEAKEVLADLNLKNKNIEEAIDMVVERVEELGYFDGEVGNISIAATSKNEDKAERLAEKLQSAVEKGMAENDVKAEVTSEAIGYEMVQAAKEIGMTPGKYNIIVNLLGIDADDAIEYVDTPMNELMEEFTASKGEAGRARAEEARENAKNGETEEENGKPAENAGLKEQNAEGKAEQAEQQERNAAVETPALDKKAPNASEMQNNASDKKPETPGNQEESEELETQVMQEASEEPEIPENQEASEKPETAGKTETPGKPENVPAGERP